MRMYNIISVRRRVRGYRMHMYNIVSVCERVGGFRIRMYILTSNTRSPKMPG
jgi:hypothetical protein